jgi:hypothetical protein
VIDTLDPAAGSATNEHYGDQQEHYQGRFRQTKVVRPVGFLDIHFFSFNNGVGSLFTTKQAN